MRIMKYTYASGCTPESSILFEIGCSMDVDGESEMVVFVATARPRV